MRFETVKEQQAFVEGLLEAARLAEIELFPAAAAMIRLRASVYRATIAHAQRPMARVELPVGVVIADSPAKATTLSKAVPAEPLVKDEQKDKNTQPAWFGPMEETALAVACNGSKNLETRLLAVLRDIPSKDDFDTKLTPYMVSALGQKTKEALARFTRIAFTQEAV